MDYKLIEQIITGNADASKVMELDNRQRNRKIDANQPKLVVSPPLPIGEAQLYTMKITLLGIDPPIWRRFVMPTFLKLDHASVFLQSFMGWKNKHAYSFTINGYCFEPLALNLIEEGEDDIRNLDIDTSLKSHGIYNPGDYELCQLIKKGSKFYYEYDFDSGWKHEIVVENMEYKHPKDPYYCISGERACPPEDCGGVDGYKQLLEILGDPDHPEHDARLRQLGGRFNSEQFDPNLVNRSIGVHAPPSEMPKLSKDAAKKKKEERKRKDAARKRNKK
ncbi:MAG: plasmid pRiA4b ORF-3 family protein [Planctomycetaceae bacterium]|jgi:hypothetical protein|nr:plasmid pRiA4b ORF-3 family protein [Planctomycetaceae bacterium]